MKALPPPVELVVCRTRGAACLVVALHAAVLAAAAALPWPPGALAAAVAALALCGALALRRVLGSDAPAAVAVGLARRIAVTPRRGVTRHGAILDDSYVGAWLTTIVWLPDESRPARTLLVLPDTFAAADFRRLRVALRYGRVAAADGNSDVDAG